MRRQALVMELSSIEGAMPPRSPTDFAAFLARADISQAAFARLTGVTPRQVNNWARGRATAPLW
ncbi:MAG TPA: helix-turn-helix domain-containing protein, partial [Gemmataceae bacterium]|nr:helix-turn-helix domain-containing protein [Gemmataceae bacterium]